MHGIVGRIHAAFLIGLCAERHNVAILDEHEMASTLAIGLQHFACRIIFQQSALFGQVFRNGLAAIPNGIRNLVADGWDVNGLVVFNGRHRQCALNEHADGDVHVFGVGQFVGQHLDERIGDVVSSNTC